MIRFIIDLEWQKRALIGPITALTVGYRGSLTEVIQIIGRCTRDSENKTHALHKSNCTT